MNAHERTCVCNPKHTGAYSIFKSHLKSDVHKEWQKNQDRISELEVALASLRVDCQDLKATNASLRGECEDWRERALKLKQRYEPNGMLDFLRHIIPRLR